MGRCCRSARTSGSQRAQNKLLVLARGNFLHVSDPSDSYLGMFSIYGCQPKSVLMLLAIEREFFKNELLNCGEGDVLFCSRIAVSKQIPKQPCANYCFFFQQLLTVTINTTAAEVTTLHLPLAKKTHSASLFCSWQINYKHCDEQGVWFCFFFFQDCSLTLSRYCDVNLTLHFAWITLQPNNQQLPSGVGALQWGTSCPRTKYPPPSSLPLSSLGETNTLS